MSRDFYDFNEPNYSQAMFEITKDIKSEMKAEFDLCDAKYAAIIAANREIDIQSGDVLGMNGERVSFYCQNQMDTLAAYWLQRRNATLVWATCKPESDWWSHWPLGSQGNPYSKKEA